MRIFIRTSFEGIHAYKDAPEEVAFLRNAHRHIFGVYVEMDVYHDDRELEFIMIKRTINRWLKVQGTDLDNMSCEQIGKFIIQWLIREYGPRDYKVIIDEDQENGAVITSDDVKGS